MSCCVLSGSYPESEDLAGRVEVGQRTTWTFDNVDLVPGLSCVAKVIGQCWDVHKFCY